MLPRVDFRIDRSRRHWSRPRRRFTVAEAVLWTAPLCLFAGYVLGAVIGGGP